MGIISLKALSDGGWKEEASHPVTGLTRGLGCLSGWLWACLLHGGDQAEQDQQQALVVTGQMVAVLRLVLAQCGRKKHGRCLLLQPGACASGAPMEEGGGRGPHVLTVLRDAMQALLAQTTAIPPKTQVGREGGREGGRSAFTGCWRGERHGMVGGWQADVEEAVRAFLDHNIMATTAAANQGGAPATSSGSAGGREEEEELLSADSVSRQHSLARAALAAVRVLRAVVLLRHEEEGSRMPWQAEGLLQAALDLHDALTANNHCCALTSKPPQQQPGQINPVRRRTQHRRPNDRRPLTHVLPVYLLPAAGGGDGVGGGRWWSSTGRCCARRCGPGCRAALGPGRGRRWPHLAPPRCWPMCASARWPRPWATWPALSCCWR